MGSWREFAAEVEGGSRRRIGRRRSAKETKTRRSIAKDAPNLPRAPLTSIVVTQCNLIVAVYLTMPDGTLLRFDSSAAVPADQLLHGLHGHPQRACRSGMQRCGRRGGLREARADLRAVPQPLSHVAPLALRGIPFAPLRLPLALRHSPCHILKPPSRSMQRPLK